MYNTVIATKQLNADYNHEEKKEEYNMDFFLAISLLAGGYAIRVVTETIYQKN